MAKTAEEVLMGVLSTTLKLDETGVASLKEEDGSFKDDSIDFVNQQYADHIGRVKGDVDRIKAERYSQGKREALEGLEKELKDEFGIKEGDKRGKDLVKAIVANATKNQLTDEAIKAHPLYLELESKANEFPKTLDQKIKEREDAIRAEFRDKQVQEQITKRGIEHFRSMNPVLPKNEKVAAAQLTLLENYLQTQGKYQVVEDGKGGIKEIIVLKADGSGRLEDHHGHPIKYEAFVEQGAKEFFEFSAGGDRKSGGDPNDTGESGEDPGVAYDPKSEPEYVKLFNEIEQTESDPAKRQAKWKALKEAGIKNGVRKA